MYKPSNPAPLYPAIGWVGNLLTNQTRVQIVTRVNNLSWTHRRVALSVCSFNLCVLPRAPPKVNAHHGQ